MLAGYNFKSWIPFILVKEVSNIHLISGFSRDVMMSGGRRMLEGFLYWFIAFRILLMRTNTPLTDLLD
jgi:hypothetical protein